MARLVIIITALLLAGCSYRINDGASRSILLVDDYELPSNVNGDFNPVTGTIRVKKGLPRATMISAVMHELTHAIEHYSNLTPRQVLRLYHSAAWPVASQDLLGD